MADPGLRALAERVQAACLAAGLRVAFAESCTGGRIGDALTDVAGSSEYVAGGIVAYEDRAKETLLGVPRDTLVGHGAVSAQVALAMAEGARTRLAADLAVAVTGIAGPDGATPGKPVGLTYVALAGPDGATVRRFAWDGNRDANKTATARAALELLLDGAATTTASREGR